MIANEVGKPQRARLCDRGVIRVTGEDATKFLGGILTSDIAKLSEGRATLAGLLSPQGKILFDGLVLATAEGFLIDTGRNEAAAFAKKLTLYRLRANVTIEDLSASTTLVAAWGGDAASLPGELARMQDPRAEALGYRVIVASNEADAALAASGAAMVSEAAYHAHRIGLAIPEAGKDYDLGDAFPHEALFDQLDGVSFTKGCYVGQEIVARMQHRGTARTRIVLVSAASPLSSARPSILAGDVEIGRLGSVAGTQGLALLRIDRAAEFAEKGVPLTADGTQIDVHVPPYATFKIAKVTN